MIRIKIEGMRELYTNLEAIGRGIANRVMRRALREATRPALDAIRAATYTTVRRRTGLLRAGLGVRGIRRRQAPGVFAAGVFTRPAAVGSRRQNARDPRVASKVPFYWKFIEFGTRNMTARPYVGAAFERAAGDMLNRFQRAMQEGLEREAARRPHK